MNSRISTTRAFIPRACRFATVFLVALPALAAAQRPAELFEKRVEMVPVRDGVQLNTEIYVPRDAEGPLPIVITRTPYGLGHDDDGYHGALSSAYESLVVDGYIFVFQDIRGRYGSGGEFVMLRPPRAAGCTACIDEGTDTYDTIEWLLGNVDGHNGKVGLLGISYGGWLTVMGLVDPHPALAAASPQASPSDMFLNDDFFHNGAFRLGAGFGYVALMERGSTNMPYDFDQHDTFEWYLDLGPLSNADTIFQGMTPTWYDFVEHASYDEFWQKMEVTRYLDEVTVPTLNVAGWWDAEDFNGSMAIYDALEEEDALDINRLVVGPWRHGGWARGPGESLGAVEFGSATSEYYRENVEAPFFRYYLKGEGEMALPEALAFQTGANEWESYATWPPRQVHERRLYFHDDGRLSWEPPSAGTAAFDEYVSDPDKPVPYWNRPVPGFWQGGQALWKVADQRFVHLRPDVLSWVTEPLEEDVAVSGRIIAELFASTTGTDADWVVKLIDVYPETFPEKPEMAGYQLMIADEVMRARFRDSFENPAPVPAGEVVDYSIDLNSRNHVFREGHRIMVQMQSTWFPLIDRNPQTYVENIFKADEDDFQKATHRIWRSSRFPSHIVLPIGSP